MRRSYTKTSPLEKANKGGADWEVRPGGMLVQKRSSGQCGVGPTAHTIKVSVSYGSYQLEVTVPAQATFGELKRIVAKLSGLESCEQRIMFKGQERQDHEFLHLVGVKDASKVSNLEASLPGDRKIPEQEITVLTELLMIQLLNLDSIEADGEAKAQRRIEVRRVQSHVERLDMLKAITAYPLNTSDRCINQFDVATKW